MSVRIFWIAFVLIAYAYAGYPLLMIEWARRHGRSPRTRPITPPLTVILAVHNEESRVAARVRNVLLQDYPAESLHVLVVDDGSTDGTAKVADIGDPHVRVISLGTNRGKAAALDAAIAQVTTDLVVFIDARQRFAPQALRKLMEPFADPAIGAVSGELVIVDKLDADRSAANIGMYWRMEMALREAEARLGCLHGVSGAIHAMRRDLIIPLPHETILDDMYLPMGVVFAHRRVWMAREAIAWDTASDRPVEEYRRKLRTLAGNWQLMALLPRLLNPVANPVFLPWCSHKLLRLVVPWLLIALLVTSARIDGVFYQFVFVSQIITYTAAATALFWPPAAARVPLLRAAGTFVMLNAAALLSLPAWLMLDSRGLWKKH